MLIPQRNHRRKLYITPLTTSKPWRQLREKPHNFFRLLPTDATEEPLFGEAKIVVSRLAVGGLDKTNIFTTRWLRNIRVLLISMLFCLLSEPNPTRLPELPTTVFGLYYGEAQKLVTSFPSARFHTVTVPS